MSAVLLVCDDERSRRQLASVLRHGRFDPKIVREAAVAGRLLRRHSFAAVVVTDLEDAELPELVHELRELTELPILVVSANGDEWDKVLALDAGADDYLTEPYGVDELLARLRAMLRRFERATEEAPIVTDDFTVHVRDRRFVMADGRDAQLTETEWKILEILLRHPGHLVRRDDLLRSVWGPDAEEKTQNLRVHMASIRRKVESNPADPRYFITAPGLGLRFVPSAAEVPRSAS
jgi:two-component system, OmpR family, KDP operon response regulator KdpE